MADINELKNRKLGPNAFKTPESAEIKSKALAEKIAERVEEKKEKETMKNGDIVDEVLPVEEAVKADPVVPINMDDSIDIVYDKEAEIEERAKANGILAGSEESKKEEPVNPYSAVCNEDGTVSEHQRNVFEDGLNDGTFVAMHTCPMCHVGKKTIRGLEVKKKIGFFKFIQKRIGYMSICANCGHVDFYATDPDELLYYFRGKAKP